MIDNKINQIEDKNPKYILYTVLCVLFFSLYLFRDVFDVGIPIYLIYAVAVLIILICDFSCSVAFLVSFSALSNTGFNSVAILLLAAAFFMRYFSVRKTKITINRNSILLVVMVYELLHCVMNELAPVTTVLKYIVFVFISFFIFSLPNNCVDRKLVINSFVWFSVAFVLLSILITLNLMSWNVNYLIAEGLRAKTYSDAVTGTRVYFLGNQNFLSALCSVNMGICVWKIIEKEKRVLNIALLFLFLFAGLLTVSKLFFGILFFFFLLLVWLMWKKHPKYGIMAFAIGVLFIILTFNLFGDTLIALVFDRFHSGMEGGDVTTGRVSTYRILYEYLRDNTWTFMLGTGILNLVYILGEGVHSSILEVIGGWGIFGIPFFVLLIRMIIKNADDYRRKNNLQINYLTYMPLVIGLVYSFGGMMFGEAGSFFRIALYMYILMEGEVRQ